MKKNLKILMVCALNAETKTAREALDENPGLNIEVQTVGVGPLKSVKNTLSAVRETKPQAIVNWGLAGALIDDWKPGDCAEIIEFAIDPPSSSPNELTLKNLHVEGALPQLNLGWRKARLVSVSRPVQSREERSSLHRRTQASLVDMEAGFLCRELLGAEIPFMCLKTVSDWADEETERQFYGRYTEILDRSKPELHEALKVICGRMLV